jgi:hypothetical protein
MLTIGQPVLGEDVRRASERVRGHAVRAGLEIRGVDAADDIGTGEVEVLVAAVVLLAAEVRRAQIGGLDHGAHRPVEDEDPISQRIRQAAHHDHSSAPRRDGECSARDSAMMSERV